MYTKSLFFLILLCFSLGVKAQKYSDDISVNLFLLDECKISINMTKEINTVFESFNSDRFSYKAYFPNLASTQENILSFKDEYDFKFNCVSDYQKERSTLLGATIAPEVVVYDEIAQKVLYRGRIDNSYFQVGNRRRVITKRDLYETLNFIVSDRDIETKETEAIGCFINYKEIE